MTAAEINRQDAPDAGRQRAEAHAFDRRPLLSVLPMAVHGVDFEIRGLDDDGRTTILSATSNGRRVAQVRTAYAVLLRRTGDRSDSYRLVVLP